MNKFDKAYELFNACQFDKSFKIFESVAQSELYTDEERAEAFNMLGVITSFFAPHLSPSEEQNPLFFFQKSLTFNPYCLDALLNIISFFGKKSHSMHNDKEAFIKAYKTIKNYLYERLDDSQRLEIEAKFSSFTKNESALSS
jgi:hypothetical protein